MSYEDPFKEMAEALESEFPMLTFNQRRAIAKHRSFPHRVAVQYGGGTGRLSDRHPSEQQIPLPGGFGGLWQVNQDWQLTPPDHVDMRPRNDVTLFFEEWETLEKIGCEPPFHMQIGTPVCEPMDVPDTFASYAEADAIITAGLYDKWPPMIPEPTRRERIVRWINRSVLRRFK